MEKNNLTIHCRFLNYPQDKQNEITPKENFLQKNLLYTCALVKSMETAYQGFLKDGISQEILNF
jgi:hypothetical protein